MRAANCRSQNLVEKCRAPQAASFVEFCLDTLMYPVPVYAIKASRCVTVLCGLVTLNKTWNLKPVFQRFSWLKLLILQVSRGVGRANLTVVSRNSCQCFFVQLCGVVVLFVEFLG